MFEIPEVWDTVEKIHEWYDSKYYIKDLYENLKIERWEEEMYNYFSQVYEELFTDLLLKKTYISSDTKKLLEILAMPIYRKTDEEKDEIYKKIDEI